MSFYLSLRPLSISLISAVKSIPFNAGGEMGGKGIVKRRGGLGKVLLGVDEVRSLSYRPKEKVG